MQDSTPAFSYQVNAPADIGKSEGVIAYIPGQEGTAEKMNDLLSSRISKYITGGTLEEGNLWYTTELSFSETSEETVDILASMGAMFYDSEEAPDFSQLSNLNLAVATEVAKALTNVAPIGVFTSTTSQFIQGVAEELMPIAMKNVGRGNFKPPKTLSVSETKAKIKMRMNFSLRRSSQKFEVYRYNYEDAQGLSRNIYTSINTTGKVVLAEYLSLDHSVSKIVSKQRLMGQKGAIFRFGVAPKTHNRLGGGDIIQPYNPAGFIPVD
ncbi:MAG: hypothetical protein COA86_10590 [Kangiella sp.]|nr:MAG: hypothetical protein COA86_10590 [Kangiella sp.]